MAERLFRRRAALRGPRAQHPRRPEPPLLRPWPGRDLLQLHLDQFTGFHAIIIPGTLRDSLFILDGLLGNTTVLDPQEIMAETAGYSDVIFGLHSRR